MVVRRVKLEDSKSNEIQSILSKNDILYHVPRVDMRTYTFPAGLRNISVRNPATGNALPSRIMLTIVSNNAYNGSVTENPFNFQHCNMTSAEITAISIREASHNKPTKQALCPSPVASLCCDGIHKQRRWKWDR